MSIPVVPGPVVLNSTLTMGGCVLSPGQTVTTLYLSDLQFEHLGNRGFTHNPLIKRYIPPADRNVIATQTAALFTDELLRHAQNDYQSKQEQEQHRHCPLLIAEVKGDVADTPHRSELNRLKQILNRRQIPVEGFASGNHDGHKIMYGVFNLASPYYEFAQKLPLIGHFSLDDGLEGTEEDPGDLLNHQATMEETYDMLHGHREDMPGAKHITTALHKADYEGYEPLGSEERVAFSPQNLERNFQTFWKPTKGTQMELSRERRFWDCIINYDIADEKHRQRGTEVNPIYIQASETARFRTEDGTEYPVFTISIDGLDHRNLIAAIGGGVSELQVRLVEIFMDRMLKENPRARFKISSHFSAQDLVGVPAFMPWRRRRNKKARQAFRKLLAREEIILYSFGHTHERKVTDLNKLLKLKRKTPLTEINAPSLIDYHPNAVKHETDYHDGRALVVEKLSFRDDPEKGRQIVIDLEYRGLDQEDLKEGKTPEVQEAVKKFTANHGYMRARETNKMLRDRHWFGWLYSHSKRALEVVLYGVLQVFVRPKKWWKYWSDFSLTQYLFDNFTVVSTVNMFNEAYHLFPFLESVAHFIKAGDEPGQLAIKAQILGLRTALMEEYTVRRHQFEEALSSGKRPAVLRTYNDLFTRARMHKISDLLMRLREGSEARAFALLAGIEASKEEFHYHKRTPTKVPNQVPTITIPVP